MSFFKKRIKAEDVKQGGGTSYIVNSGVYPVNIIAPIVSVSKGGSTSVDLFINHDGQYQIIYGNLRISNNDGNENEIGTKIFNQLLVVSGTEEVADPVDGELPIGKKGAMKDVSVLEDLVDTEVLLWIQIEYGKYNGSITEKKVIRGFYQAGTSATAEEIVNESEAGIGYEKDSKYFDKVNYKDVTEADVTAWIAADRPKGTSGGGSKGGSKPSFGAKKKFGK